jgi:sugar/nucleoside kinase (ribokinase family)
LQVNGREGDGRTSGDPDATDVDDAPQMPDTFDYLAVGHVTVDLIADAPGGPRRQPGGGAFHSALQAARLGLRSAIVTCGRRDELEELLRPYRDELTLHIVPAAETTTLRTEGSGSSRHQRLLAWAGPIPDQRLPLRTGILHLAPIARELAGDCGIDADFVGLTPQGLVRAWAKIGEELTPSVLDPSALPPRCDAAVLSTAEQPYCEALLSGQRPPASRPIVAVTAGAGATTVQLPGGETVNVTPPRLLTVRDDLGAGDVFAAAFFVALWEGQTPQTPQAAAAFGNAAAVVKIAGEGPGAIGDRDAIEAVLARNAGRE